MNPGLHMRAARTAFVACLFVLLGALPALGQTDPPLSCAPWTLYTCPGGEVRDSSPGEEDVWMLVARCSGSETPDDGAAPCVRIDSPRLDAHANWHLQLNLRRIDPLGVLRVDLVDADGIAKHSVLLDPGACRWLDAPTGSRGEWTEARGREWMDTSWWLEEEHLFELRYHASPRSVSVRFDWNYMAFVYASSTIDADSFTFRLHAEDATPNEAPSPAFALWEVVLEERESLPRW